MPTPAKIMTIEGFLDLVKRRHELQHSAEPTPIGDGLEPAKPTKPDAAPPKTNAPYYKPLLDRPFCFILGAGASITSGIPSGGQLAKQWLEDMHRREDTARGPLSEWATAKNLGEEEFEDFEFARYAEWYPQLFERYFRGNVDYANAWLQDMMKKATPSFGYSILAWILARTRHSVVITTNFDNLVADSLFLYAHTSPLVIGHESLARFVRTEPGRPLVCKIHRDLLFDPMNDEDAVSYLRTEWQGALHKLLQRYTPIVIGYGGNDGSLMDFLQHMPSLGADGIFWTYRSTDGNADDLPSDRIQKLVKKHQGWLVPVYGFDELMAQFAELFQVRNLYDELKQSAEDACKRYKEASQELIYRFANELAEKATGTERERLYRAALYHAEQSDMNKEWAYWEIRARAAGTPDEQEEAYREGVKNLPGSAPLLGNYAVFLQTVRQKQDEAEKFYQRAIKADPDDVVHLGNYAYFLTDVCQKHEEAEALYQRAVEADPEHANNLGNYALLLETVRHRYDEAEEFYKRAIAFGSNDAFNLGNYASFLTKVRQKHDEAEDLYKRAIASDLNDASNLRNYANFLSEVRRQDDEAERFYQRAIASDPNNVNTLGHYAGFLTKVRQKHDEAEQFYKRAIEADPQHAIHLGNYAVFLETVRQKPDEAEEFYKRAIAANPKHADNLGNYADFLEKVRNKFDQAEAYYRRSVAANPRNPRHLYDYAALLAKKPANKAKALELVEAVLRISPDDDEAKKLAKYLKARAAPDTANGSQPTAHRPPPKPPRRKKETERQSE